MSELQPFVYGSQEVRTVQIEGEPWFVLNDLCSILELGSPHKVAARVELDDRSLVPVIDSLGRQQQTTIVNEGGMYEVIVRSDSPNARPFRRWVTHEVLPQIRKTGSYSVKELTRSDLARMVIESEAQLEAATMKVQELTPLADSYRRFLDADGTLPMGAVAQILGVGRQTLFDWLKLSKVIQRDRRPYAPYQDWFTVKATSFERSSGATGVSYTVQLKPEGLEPLRALMVRRGYLTNEMENVA